MRSFAAISMHLFVSSVHSIVLLDEPEAFLHPPQAKLLGNLIVSERSKETQLFVSTHSPSVVLGLVSAKRENLKIVRLHRDGDINRVNLLDSAFVSSIAEDPLLRYTSLLDAIFHERAIVCEGDADSMFYNMMMDAIHDSSERVPDLLFTHSGGKQRLPVFAQTLRNLGVSFDLIVDIDVFNDGGLLRKIVESVGGDWEKISSTYTPFKEAIESQKPTLSDEQVRLKLKEISDASSQFSMTQKEIKKKIDSFFRSVSPWDSIKASGEAAIPSGEPTKNYKELSSSLRELGIHVVPVGELEGFVREIGGKGTRWVQEVVSSNDLRASENLEAARKFVHSVKSRGLAASS